MNGWELMPVLLLLLFSIAMSIGLSMIVAVVRRARQRARNSPLPEAPPLQAQSQAARSCPASCVFRRPTCWLAVKSRNIFPVQCALGLHNPKPCSWIEALAGDEKLFIAPPVKGWVLVMGSGLPDPSDDVDVCFRFLMELSRKLGQVQYFSASRVLHYHAWVKADHGKVVRAYAWAGRTVWEQGAETSAEKELDLKTFGYTEPVERASFNQPDAMTANTEKVPLLAARWSLDPGRIDERALEKESGIAGEPSRRF